jgi:protein involved in polysaccharide export with SLBB domain
VVVWLATVLVWGSPPAAAQDQKAQDFKAQSEERVPGQERVPATDSDYHLGSFDQVRLKVVAWRPSQAEIIEWNAVNGEYTVDAGGKISVPLIGAIRAAGVTTAEFASRVAEQLQERLNITQKLNATVEIIKFRPFYIVGDVANSGEYSYRPGMTVIQAMSIAGGLPRSHAIDVHQIERDVAGWTGELNALADERSTVNAQIEQQEKLLLLAQQDKQLVDSKQKTGLVTEPRILASQRDLATAESELLRLKGRLREIGFKIATNKAQISQSDRIAPTWTGAQLSFSIVRPEGSRFSEIPAEETTLVEPGDTVKVKCCTGEPPESSASAQAQSFLVEGAPNKR